MNRFLIFDIESQADRYTIIDTVVVYFDSPNFWMNIASFGNSSEVSDVLQISFDQYRKIKQENFECLGKQISIDSLEGFPRQFAEKFMRLCDERQKINYPTALRVQ